MKLTVIHTTLATITTIPSLIKDKYNDYFEIVNILDDSLLNEIKVKGDITNNVIEKFIKYCLIAEENNSDAILLACSSIGKAADIARKFIGVPIYKIDEPMANKASNFNKILVIGTVESTLKPSSDLIKSKLSGDKKLETKLIKDVFELYGTNKKLHDESIAKVVNENIDLYDVIVLAQASMSGAIDYISNKEKILTSLPIGIAQLDALVKS